MVQVASLDLTTYMGLDPGASGGIAFICGGYKQGFPMPPTEKDIWELIKIQTVVQSVFAVIEKVGGFIQGNPAPGSAMFKFGAGYGGLRMALIATGVTFEEITPQAWQKAMGIGARKKTESKTQFKNRIKAKAQQLFPKLTVTLATADALVIAEYCRRKHTGAL